MPRPVEIMAMSLLVTRIGCVVLNTRGPCKLTPEALGSPAEVRKRVPFGLSSAPYNDLSGTFRTPNVLCAEPATAVQLTERMRLDRKRQLRAILICARLYIASV